MLPYCYTICLLPCCYCTVFYSTVQLCTILYCVLDTGMVLEVARVSSLELLFTYVQIFKTISHFVQLFTHIIIYTTIYTLIHSTFMTLNMNIHIYNIFPKMSFSRSFKIIHSVWNCFPALWQRTCLLQYFLYSFQCPWKLKLLRGGGEIVD